MSAKTLSLRDVQIAAFLAFHGIQPQLEILDGSNRVVFVFPATDDVRSIINLYNSDAPIKIPLFSYMEKLKLLRSQMLTLRNLAIQRTRGNEAKK
jgi:Domain of unknown function (DUF5659)